MVFSKKAAFFAVILLFGLSGILSAADYGLKLQKETDHFRFFCNDKDVPCLDDYAGVLESKYADICFNLKVTMTKKVTIYFYPDLVSYHNATNRPDAPDWSVGNGGINEIRMVSPLNPGPVHTYEGLKKTIVHEFVHVMNNTYINPQMPRYLNEGIAYYEAKQFNPRKSAMLQMIRANNIPTLPQLESARDNDFTAIQGYDFCCLVVEYTITQYSYDHLLQWMSKPGSFKRIFNLSQEQFYQNWVEYLRNRFK